MTYTLRFFTHENKEEKFITECNFDYLPFVPRANDLIIFELDQYIVRRVSTDYDDNENQSFDIMTDSTDENKEWWE